MTKKLVTLVGGMYREFDIAHKSWSFLNHSDSDVFISTWNKTFEINEKLNTHIQEDVDESRIKKHLPNANIKISEDTTNFTYIYKLIYHWKNLLDMVKKSGNKYDIAILIRPDFCIKENIKLNEFIDGINNTNMYSLTNVEVRSDYPFIYVNDCFFISKYENIERMINFLDLKSEFYDIHIYLSKYFIDNRVYVESISPKLIEYYVCRSIHRKTQNLDFYENKKIGIDWWDIKNKDKVSDELIENIKKYV
jgi:hypothetical protein